MPRTLFDGNGVRNGCRDRSFNSACSPRCFEYSIPSDLANELEATIKRNFEVVCRRLRHIHGVRLYDPIVVTWRHAFGTSIRVFDSILVLEENIELSTDFVVRARTVIVHHERIDKELIPDGRSIATV